MQWFAVRIAFALVFWMLCSGSFSLEELRANASSSRSQQRQQQATRNNESICVSSAEPLVYENSSILEDTRDNDLVHVLVPRGGSDEFPYDLNSTTTSAADEAMEEESNDVTIEEQQDNDVDVFIVDDKDDNDEAVDTANHPQAPVPQEQPITPTTTLLSASLKNKVANRIQKWKNKGERRTVFLDRMALVSDALLQREHDALLDKEEDQAEIQDTTITHQSDLTRPRRYFTIVTTAALPWMTGTAVNPLLRAAHLVQKTQSINQKNSTTTSSTNTQWVTLVVPWLELEEDQQALYGRVFRDQDDQEEYIRTWLRENAEMPDAADPESGLKIRFYPARYHPGLGSIFAMGDICALIPDEEADVCILEEPEHLNWYRAPGKGWTKKFHYVVGIVHTNYKEYASAHYTGLWTAPAIAVMSSAMVRAYCHKVIKLSDVLQTFAPEKEETSNIHGVRSEFLKEGLRRAREAESPDYNAVEVMRRSQQEPEETIVYFIGKLLWAKGLDLMLDMEEYYKQCTGEYFAIDVYGSGPEQTAIMRSFHGRKKLNGDLNDSDDELDEETSILLMDDDDDGLMGVGDSPEGSIFTVQFKTRQRLQRIKDTIKATTESLEFDLPKSLHEYRRQPIPATFPGRVDHALLTKQYKVFINPSISEVLCTTTAEALAMGKFAIIPVHPSNTFFLRFPNCLAYRNKFEFVANLRWALTHEPEPLTPELAQEFTWQAATERLIEASAITHREALERERLGLSKRDERIAWFHNELGKGVTGDAIRKVLGGGPVSKQVKYQRAQQVESDDIIEEAEDILSDEESEDDDEGLPSKLRMSSFGAAIRSTVANGLPSLKAGGSSG